jgi:hypothetical protein
MASDILMYRIIKFIGNFGNFMSSTKKDIMKRNQREQKILPLRFWNFPKTRCLYWWIKTFLHGFLCCFLCSLHLYSCRNVLNHQYKHLVFGEFQNCRGNIFCSRWFLFIISFLVPHYIVKNSIQNAKFGSKVELEFLE